MKGALEWLEGKVGRRMTLAEESAAGNMTPTAVASSSKTMRSLSRLR